MIHFPPWKKAVILAVCLIAALLALPNALPTSLLAQLPTWLPSRQVSLGLDLQGGSHLLLQIDLDTITKDRMNNLSDSVRAELRKGQIGYTGLTIDQNKISLRLRDGTDRAKAREALIAADSDMTIAINDDLSVLLTFSPQALQQRRQAALQQALEIIRRRVDETGTKEPTIQQQGQDRILVQLPGVRDPERIKALIGTTAKLTFRMVDTETSVVEALRGRLPASSELLSGDRTDSATGQTAQYVVRKRIMVSGDTLVDAQPSFQDNQPVVSFKFDSVGARRFGEATTENVGKPFAIVLDNKVLSAPVIREAITGGRGIISGSFTTQSASDLALLLRAGALPAPLTVIEERTVGPDLGADSIEAGAIASVAGLVLICLLMLVGYGLFGIFANIALVVNVVIILAVMSVLQATLTLPGIGGMVLSLGMAVDANVLIYERMREEMRLGRSPISAVDAGFSRAFLTILDSNLTTLIAAVLLYAFGSGPVRGFAVTLSIGLIASMFTAVTVTRLMVVTWLMARRRQALPL